MGRLLGLLDIASQTKNIQSQKEKGIIYLFVSAEIISHPQLQCY